MNNIPMNAPMALVTQQGIKTHTRREFKRGRDYCQEQDENGNWVFENEYGEWIEVVKSTKAPYKIGQVLWVREPAKVIGYESTGWQGAFWNDSDEFGYKFLSDGFSSSMEIPSRFEKLPKWIEKKQGIPNGCIREMARTFIRVTNIRVERLNEISEEDAMAEGISEFSNCNPPQYDRNRRQYGYEGLLGFHTAKTAFKSLWESINGKDSFDNRWVWVIEFELISKEETMR